MKIQPKHSGLGGRVSSKSRSQSPKGITLEAPPWGDLEISDRSETAPRANGLGALLDEHPFSYCYLMRWKLDFTGEGSPPQRNAWFVWRRDWSGEPAFRWMDKTKIDPRQDSLI